MLSERIFKLRDALLQCFSVVARLLAFGDPVLNQTGFDDSERASDSVDWLNLTDLKSLAVLARRNSVITLLSSSVVD